MNVIGLKKNTSENTSENTSKKINKKSDIKDQNFDLFLNSFVDHLPKNYFTNFSHKEFHSQIATLWEQFRNHKPDIFTININESSMSDQKISRLLLTITGPDRQYLVDSINILLSKWGLKAEVFIHPVLSVLRSSDGSIQSIEKRTSNKDMKANSFETLESVNFIQMKNRLLPDEIESFIAQVNYTLNQVMCVNDDKRDLLKELSHLSSHLQLCDSTKWSEEDVGEAQNFLKWIDDRYFVFLGARYFSAHTSAETPNFICLESNITSAKGIFRDEAIRDSDDLVPFFFRAKVSPQDDEMAPKAPLETFPLVRVSKTNKRSNIQRSSRIDSIEVLDWDQTGKIKGIFQFVGIFKKELFILSSLKIPLIRQKAERVFNRFGVEPDWHDGKSLMAILESIPRDEMFYLPENEIYDICSEVSHLQEGGGVRVFLRADPYGRYKTVMVFLSREKFSQQLKDDFGEILSRNLGGSVASEVVQLGDLPFARIIYVIEFEKPNFVNVNVDDLDILLEEASLTWLDNLENYINKETNETDATTIVHKFKKSFPVSYQEKFEPEEAYEDICLINRLTDNHPTEINMYFQEDKQNENNEKPNHISSIKGILKIKIHHFGKSLLLSDLLPILSNMGIKVLSETTHHLKVDNQSIFIHDFDVSLNPEIKWLLNLDFFRNAFLEIWSGTMENDGFNQLILGAGLNSRQVNTIRAYIKYLLQARLPYSQSYIENALSQHPLICQHLIEYFESRFHIDQKNLRSEYDILDDINLDLNHVALLDHDKIIRRLLNAIQSTLRTNYFQEEITESGKKQPKSYFSFKFDSHQLDNLPSPRPKYEVFVYSSRVEAVHLRGGKVARGGIRWSDRVEDFRTEVLGLMKAQMVKNSVIIPVGAKGGFIVKRQHQLADRNQVLTEAIFCYQTFIRGLLDITDNLVKGNLTPPPRVIRYDHDDPYLVVAADKGTASFSDIANNISKDYKFWLDDAFASGGSVGYDHKKMAITSRGAWESVKRHFREIGIDVQMEPFTVAGVGDMSGDVFGNGMLRSEKICLVFAFDHRHILIDPHPNPRHSFLERKRLFDLPRSSWADYNKDILSKGGGIYSRAEKKIHLSPEAQSLLNLKSPDNTPDDVVRAILTSQVDLMWFGGIGTFVKGSLESSSDVGDMINSGVRIDGKMIRAKVVVEGANLAMTQRGRIEYALEGGRINTDAIDNSAGVDCSDHEVNIKILFSSLKKPLTPSKRNKMLIDMTDDVAQLVLQNNYDQTKVLTFMQALGKDNIAIYQDLIKLLESEIQLNRTLEFLPDEETYERRKLKGQGMTRPELAIILAYSKMALVHKIMTSNVVNNKENDPFLISYFPDLIQKEYSDEILRHPLRRDILATLLANSLINHVGPTFVYEVCHVSGCSPAEVVDGFYKVSQLLNLEQIWNEIDSLDSLMLTDIQIKAYTHIAQSVKIAVLRILGTSIVLSKSDASDLLNQLTELIEGKDKQSIAREMYTLQERGLSFHIIEKLVILPYLSAIIDLGAVQRGDESLLEISKIYFKVRSHFNLDLLQSKTLSLEVSDEWQRTAQLGLLDDIGQLIIALTQNVVSTGCSNNIEDWLKSQEGYYKQAQGLLSQLKSTSRPDIGMLTFAIRQLQRMPQVKRYLCSI